MRGISVGVLGGSQHLWRRKVLISCIHDVADIVRIRSIASPRCILCKGTTTPSLFGNVTDKSVLALDFPQVSPIRSIHLIAVKLPDVTAIMRPQIAAVEVPKAYSSPCPEPLHSDC